MHAASTLRRKVRFVPLPVKSLEGLLRDNGCQVGPGWRESAVCPLAEQLTAHWQAAQYGAEPIVWCAGPSGRSPDTTA